MATILNNKKSTYSNPYAYYTVEVTGISNRTATSVDITFKITSNLGSSSSKLGKGYTLKSNLYIKEDWSEDIELKSSSESWSGTTKHYKTQTITVTGLSSNNTTLSNIKFKVVSSANDHAAGLNATNCENITIPIYHQPPTFTTTIEELNQNLINANVSNDVFIKDLSKKRITFNVTTYESAELWSVIAKNKESNDSRNENTWINAGGDNKLIIDLKDITLIEYINNLQHVLLSYSVTDDLGGQAEYKNVIYPYTLYNKPAIIEDNTFIKRAGQLSGNVSLTINGSYYNNLVGDTTPTIRHIYYKYWQVGSTEPSTYTNEIPTASITASNGQFNVNNYVVSNIDPQIAYRFKIKVEDDFSEYETAEYPIAVGKPIWTEHKDYVDFKKLTVKKREVFPIELMHAITNYSPTLNTTDIKINLLESIKIGNEFSITNDKGILIGANTNIIKINAQVWFSTGFNSGDSYRMSIYKNNIVVATSGGRTQSANAYETANISNKIIEVQENDVIYLYCRNATGNRGTISSDEELTFVTVEKVG